MLTGEERLTLERLTNRRKTAQAMALRARIVLACAEKDRPTNTQVAARLGFNQATVGKWRRRFVAERLDGLFDDPRPGVPRSVTDDKVEAIVVKTLEETPCGATHWSTRSMAAASGVSPRTVGRIWRAFGLKPHLSESFKLSTDPLFIDKVRDVVGLYLDPPERAVVLCVDEKSQIQALNRTQPILPLTRGGSRAAQPRLRTPRHRQPVRRLGPRHRSSRRLAARPPPGHRVRRSSSFASTRRSRPRLDVHLVLDNYGTHKTPAVKAWLERHPRFHLHFVPTSSSWLNLVERSFGELTMKKIRRGTHRSVRQPATAQGVDRALERRPPSVRVGKDC